MRTTLSVVLCLCLVSCGAERETEQRDPLAAPEMKDYAPYAVGLGWEHFSKGNSDTALMRFRMAVRHDATYAPGYYGIAYVHSLRGELDEAIKYYRLALEHDQTYPYTFANLGLALLQKREFEEGLQMLDKALQLKPDCGEAHLSYANYYAFKQEWKEAEQSVNKAVTYGQKIHPELRALLSSNGVQIIEEKTPNQSTDRVKTRRDARTTLTSE